MSVQDLGTSSVFRRPLICKFGCFEEADNDLSKLLKSPSFPYKQEGQDRYFQCRLRYQTRQKGRLKNLKSVFQTTFCSSLQARYAQHAFDVAEAGEDAREVVDLLHFKREPHAGFQVAGLGLHCGNVEFVAGERVGYIA